MNDWRVLQVIDTLNIGGAERVFVDLTNLLHESGMPVTTMFLLEAGILQYELNPSIKKIEIKRQNKFAFKAFVRTARLLRGFQIIHCHSKHTFRYIRLVQRLASIRAQVILQDHGLLAHASRPPLLLRGFLKPAYYVGVSRELTEWASSELRIPNDRIFLLENIIRKKPANLHSDEGSGLVLVSNIKPTKNQLFILDVVKNLQVDLTFIGRVQDPDYYSKLFEESRCVNQVQTLTNVSDIQPRLSAYRLGLHTSFAETGPLVLIEYLAQGLPFLAYETGEVARILKPYFPQYFINNFDVRAWTERISVLLQQKPDRMLMKSIFQKHFGSRQYVEKCRRIYESIRS